MATILAVDDSVTIRKCLEIAFSGTGITLVAVESAEAALEQVKTISPDLVIADVSLPPNDGYELCGTIKLAEPQLPVLMLSSKQNPFDPTKGAQADDHIDKPFDTQALHDKARQLIEAGPSVGAEVAAAASAQPAAAAPSSKPVAMPERAPSSKIPAPRRKRPTPAMVAAVGPDKSPPPGAAAARRTVPFAMPGSSPRTAQGVPTADALRKAAESARAKADAPATEPTPTPTPARPAGMPRKAPAAPHDELEQKPVGDTLPGTPSPVEAAEAPAPQPEAVGAAPADAAVLPAAAAADMKTQLEALGLTKDQMEGVLALSRDIVEQVVWEVVPTLAETLIKEEIRRLTQD